MLPNSETERLGFVQVSIVNRGPWGNLIKTTINAAYGYSIEVFRGRSYIGSIAVTDKPDANQVQQQLRSMKVQNGDTLIWVSLTPRKIEMNVPLTTVDGNYPVCKLTIMLRVEKSRTRDFANLFNQDNDPVEIIKSPITNVLQRYARQRSYHQLDEDDMRYRVQQSLYGDNKQYGLTVDSVPHLSVSPDEHISQRIQATQQADTQALQDRLDQDRTAQKSDFDRKQDALQREHQRSQLRRDKDYQREDELQDSYNQVLKDALPKRLQRDLMAGKSIYHIREEYPELRSINAISPAEQPARELPWQERARLAPGTPESMRALDNITSNHSLEEDDEEPIPGLLQQNRVVFGLRESGISVIRVQISATQRNKAGVQTLTAMLVCQVDADDGAFAVGDLITMIEGIAITDIQVLVTILKEKHPATLSAQILRGEKAMEAPISSMP